MRFSLSRILLGFRNAHQEKDWRLILTHPGEESHVQTAVAQAILYARSPLRHIRTRRRSEIPMDRRDRRKAVLTLNNIAVRQEKSFISIGFATSNSLCLGGMKKSLLLGLPVE